MTSKFQLTEAANTWNHALEILKIKGYRLWEEKGWYCAEKEGRRFNATGPLQLLGLVALWAQFGDRWRDLHPKVDLLARQKKVRKRGRTQ